MFLLVFINSSTPRERGVEDEVDQVVGRETGRHGWRLGQSVEHLALHEGGDVDWDVVQLVYYPSRDTFIEMVTSEEYLTANEHRANGTEKHLIFATKTMISNPFPEK